MPIPRGFFLNYWVVMLRIIQLEPVVGVARQLGVTEGALRYHLRQGNLKKRVADRAITGCKFTLGAQPRGPVGL